MAEHGNSNANDKPHHLYEIRDSVDDDVFKYGISDEPIYEEGYSIRMKIQVDFLNLGVKWLRFFARVILFNIPGRQEAKRLEKQYIRKYKDENGKPLRGNKEQ